MEWYLDPIHHAAYYGDMEAIDRLLQEDAGLLNAQFRGRPSVLLTGHDAAECTPLMLAAYRGHDAVVARLLAVGANTNLQSHYGCHATNWACTHTTTHPLLPCSSMPVPQLNRNAVGHGLHLKRRVSMGTLTAWRFYSIAAVMRWKSTTR